MKKKKKRKKSLQSLKHKAWKLFSLWIRQKDADHRGFNYCVSCGKVDHWKSLQAGHFIPKSHGLVYYFHEKNVHPQCERCNIWDKENAKIKYMQFMIDKYGIAVIAELQELKQMPVKYSRTDYEELIKKFTVGIIL